MEPIDYGAENRGYSPKVDLVWLQGGLHCTDPAGLQRGHRIDYNSIRHCLPVRNLYTVTRILDSHV